MGLNLNQLAAIQMACGDAIAALLEKKHDKYLEKVTQPMDAKFDFDQALEILRNKPEIFEAINLSSRYAGVDANGRMKECTGSPEEKHWNQLRVEYNTYTLDWLSLHACVRHNTAIPQELKDRMLKAHPNFNILHVAHMEQYEENLKKDIQDEESVSNLVRLHEGCLGMTPLTAVSAAGYSHLRHRLGRVPFNLDKMGDPTIPPEEYREVVSWLIETRTKERREAMEWFVKTHTEDQKYIQVSSNHSENEIVKLIQHMQNKHMLTEELIAELRNANTDLESVRITLANVRADNERMKHEKAVLERKLGEMIQPSPEDDVVDVNNEAKPNVANDNSDARPNAANDNSDNRTPLLGQTQPRDPHGCGTGILFAPFVIMGIIILPVALRSSSNDSDQPSQPGIVSFSYDIPWQNGGNFCINNANNNPFSVNTYQFTLRGKITEIWGPKANSLFPYGSVLSIKQNEDSTYTCTVVSPHFIPIPSNNYYCTEFNIDPASVVGPLQGISGFPPAKYPVIANGQTLPLYKKCSGSACENPTPRIELSLDYSNSLSDDPQNNPRLIPTKFVNAVNYRVDFNASGALLPTYADTFLVPYVQRTSQQYPFLRKYLEVGGWGTGDDFTKIVSNTNTTKLFIQNLILGVGQAEFNGVSIKLDLISGKLPLNDDGIANFFETLHAHASKDIFENISIKVVVPGSRYGMNLLQPGTWKRIAAINPKVTVNTNLNGAYSSETNFQSPLEVDKNDPLYAQDPTLSIRGSLNNYRQFFSRDNMGPTIYMDGQCIKIADLGPRQNGVWVPPIGDCGTIPYHSLAEGLSQATCISPLASPYPVTMSSFCYTPNTFITFTNVTDAQAITRYVTNPEFSYGSMTATSTSGKWGDTISIKGAREDLSLIAAISRTANATNPINSNLFFQNANLVNESKNTMRDTANSLIQQIQLPAELRSKMLEAAGKGILSSYLLELISKGFLVKYLEERHFSKTQIFCIDQAVRAILMLLVLEGSLQNAATTLASPLAVKLLVKLGFSGTTANAIVSGGVMSASIYASPLIAIPTMICSIPAAKLAGYVAESAPIKLVYSKTAAAVDYLAETRVIQKSKQISGHVANSLFTTKEKVYSLATKLNPFAKKPSATPTEIPLQSIQCNR